MKFNDADIMLQLKADYVSKQDYKVHREYLMNGTGNIEQIDQGIIYLRSLFEDENDDDYYDEDCPCCNGSAWED